MIHLCENWEGPVLWSFTADDGRNYTGLAKYIEFAIRDIMALGLDVQKTKLWGVEQTTRGEGEFFHKLGGKMYYLDRAWPEALRGEKEPCFED